MISLVLAMSRWCRCRGVGGSRLQTFGGGPTASRIGVMFSTFGLGLGVLLLPRRRPSLLLLVTGSVMLEAPDREAAQTRQQSRSFALLRPTRMLPTLIDLSAMLCNRSDGGCDRD